MRTRRFLAAFLCSALLMQASRSALAQVPPPAPVPSTIWSFLGIPQAYYKVRGTMFNRKGNHPGLEPGPPLKNIADPANLKSPFEAVKAAAEVKQAEDAAPQKIKGIKYLATIGCGCYDTKEDPKITKAMLAGLSDNTEEVRLATVNAIASAAEGEACQKCGTRSCCKKVIVMKMAVMAYERDEFGCYLEPSADVRAAAVEAICICCPSSIPVEVIEEEANGGRREPVPDVGPERTREPVPGNSALIDDPATAMTRAKWNAATDPSKRVRVWVGDQKNGGNMLLSAFNGARAGGPTESPQVTAADRQTKRKMTFDAPPLVVAVKPKKSKIDLSSLRGVIEHVDQASGFVTIRISRATAVPVGTKINIYHGYLFGESRVGQVEVVHTSKRTVSARTINRGPLRQAARGDKARFAN